jgi:hypothetical protein
MVVYILVLIALSIISAISVCKYCYLEGHYESIHRDLEYEHGIIAAYKGKPDKFILVHNDTRWYIEGYYLSNNCSLNKIHTIIKVFDSDDEEYNKLKAEELLEKLTESID